VRFIEVLRERKPGPTPIWLMRQAGRYLPEYRAVRARAGSFLDLCYTPELAVEVTLQPIRRFGFDAAILFSDILVIPDALGQQVNFVEGEGPRLDAISDEAGVNRLDPERVLRHLEPVLETVSQARGTLDAKTALIGFCGAPWTVATYMVAGCGTPDQAPARLWAYRDPKSFNRLIDILVDSSARYLNAQIGAGADALQIFDTWAGSLPATEFDRWCVAPIHRLVQAVRAEHPGVPVIVFPRGACDGYARLADDVAPEGIGIDTGFSVDRARDELQPKTVVQGNLDPLALVAGGDVLKAGIERIMAALAGGPFIFNLGHGIVPETPVAHVADLVEQVRRHAGG
jgi:uroporphyrinogen decarboxylase